jgi:leucyl/phenylalanyl-tRNA--protein transferase
MVSAQATRVIPVPILLAAYRRGRFPMCHADGELYWHDPDPRAVFPLGSVEPDPKTAALLRRKRFRIGRDEAFEAVMRACADRPETWIDERLIASYLALHNAGHAHCVACWDGAALVGGIYGVAIGGAFFAESMFGRDNAGKVAFHALVRHLRARGFMLLDTQYINPFTRRLGAVEIPRARFMEELSRAVDIPVRFEA